MRADLVAGEIVSEDWYVSLVEECKAIITEAVFTSRWALVEGYHGLGERIVTDDNFQKFAKGNRSCFADLRNNTGISESTLYRATQFYEKYPDLDLLPGGKNMTWNKVIALLPEPKKKDSPQLPSGRYGVIYADPPWPVGSMVLDKWESPIEDKYPTMEIHEIEALPVADLAAEQCSLFLWTTHTFLPDAIQIMGAWGFTYFCCITWGKGGGWTQNGFHKNTELLLYGYRGGINIDQRGDAIPTLICEKKGKHSKKPDIIRDLIRDKTKGERLEMFARETHEGWTVWGNEIVNE